MHPLQRYGCFCFYSHFLPPDFCSYMSIVNSPCIFLFSYANDGDRTGETYFSVEKEALFNRLAYNPLFLCKFVNRIYFFQNMI